MRAFIAIDMPDLARDALSDLQSDLPTGRLAPHDNLHLTLAFLGEQPVELFEDAHAALTSLDLPAFDLQLAGTDTFGGNAPKVLFVGARPNPALDRLHAKIRSLLHGAGLMLDRQRFRPHVTLARFPARVTAPEMERLRRWLLAHADFVAEPFRVDHVTLYRSEVGRGGAVHDPLARYLLT